MSLTPEERRRVYEEEKARLEAQEQAKAELGAAKAKAKAEEEAKAKREAEKRNKRGGLFGCLFTIGIIVLIVYGNAHWSHNTSPAPASSTSAPASSASLHQTSAQHLHAAEKAVAMWLEDQGKDPFQRRFGTVDTAMEELAAINQADLTPAERIRYQRALAGFRPMYAVVLVARFADHGLDVNVGIEGADKTTVRLKYVGWSRMMIDDLEKARVIDRHELRTYGFHQVVLTPTVDQGEYRLNLGVAR